MICGDRKFPGDTDGFNVYDYGWSIAIAKSMDAHGLDIGYGWRGM